MVTGKGVYVLPLPQSFQCLSEHSREEEKEPPPSVGEEVSGIILIMICRNKKKYHAACSVAVVPECGEEPRREEETNNPPRQLTPVAVLQATPEEIQWWQEQLQAAREAVGQELSGGVQFYRREGLLYQHWHPRDQTEDGVQACEQLVLPECCCHPLSRSHFRGLQWIWWDLFQGVRMVIDSFSLFVIMPPDTQRQSRYQAPRPLESKRSC